MFINSQIIERAKRKARKSSCRYRIAAIGLSDKGEIIDSSFNKPRFVRRGGGLHAEMIVMLKNGLNLKTIILCRCNSKGKILPINSCKVCAEKAKELGIRIITIRR